MRGRPRPTGRRRGALVTTVAVTPLALAAALGTVPPAAAAGPATGAPAVARTTPGSGWAGARWDGKLWGDKDADTVSQTNGQYVADKDPGALATVTTAIGARALWNQRDAAGRAITGQGVTVALIDSGVSSVPGLDAPGKVLQGPDLSIEANDPAVHDTDTYGHGTHLAGIIAARDTTAVDAKSGQPKPSGGSTQLGVAPDARVLALKLATRDGSTDVSQVIAALDWVVTHRNDNGMTIKVVNLSYGTHATQGYRVDPLAAAAENAWKHGITVVVSGGNDGPTAGGLTDPAVDPYVIAVGASDARTTLTGWKVPAVADFSSRGTSARHVDLLAPGRSITSLRDPGSFVDANNPLGLVTGDTSGRLFRGSGTSQAAAVVSGAVALLAQAAPTATPDQIKAALVSSADQMVGVPAVDAGAGQLDVDGALAAVRSGAKLLPSVLNALTVQSYPAAAGTGSLEAARGGSNLVDPDTGTALTGEVDVQGQPWAPATWQAASATGSAWVGGRWNGARWTGAGWSGARWTSATWDGARWTGARWTDSTWDGARWTDASWTGARWTGARWTDKGWN